MCRYPRCTIPTGAPSRATTTPACTPRCSPRSPPPTAATRSPTAKTSTPPGLQEVVRAHFGERAETFPVFNGTGANVVGAHQRAAALGRRRRADDRAHPHRRGRRPGAGHRPQAAHRPDAGRQAHARAGRARGLGLGRRAPRAAARREHHADHRARHAVHARRGARDLPTSPTSTAWRCTWTAPGSGTRPPRSASPFREFTTDAGVDILSLGGTKNGLLGAEAVVVLDPDRVDGLVFLRKMTMQLASKMRFVSAQLLALFDDDLGLRSAAHANAMAARLRGALEAGIADGTLRGLAFTQPTQANAVFATLPTRVADRIRERVRFYDWDRARGEVRWMTAWDTTERTSTASWPSSPKSSRADDHSLRRRRGRGPSWRQGRRRSRRRTAAHADRQRAAVAARWRQADDQDGCRWCAHADELPRRHGGPRRPHRHPRAPLHRRPARCRNRALDQFSCRHRAGGDVGCRRRTARRRCDRSRGACPRRQLVGRALHQCRTLPGWGRAQESYGEDPFLLGEMGARQPKAPSRG